MDLQEYASKIIEAKRKDGMIDSPQLTLGQLIKELEEAGIKNDKGEDKNVDFDFGSAIPTVLTSWRGSYAELALGYRLSGYDVPNEKHFGDCIAAKLLEELKSGVGATYEGWKGGDFKMDMDTPVWVANPGNADNTAIIGVLNLGYRIIILTAYCEY